MTRENSVDAFIEGFQKMLKGIPHVDALLTDPKGVDLVELMTAKAGDLNWLLKHNEETVIPALRNLAQDRREELKTSKYAHLLNIEFEANAGIYEAVRNAYVALNHHWENYHKNVFDKVEGYIPAPEGDKLTLRAYALKTFGFDLGKDRNLDLSIWVANWVANSTKHRDGKPIVDSIKHPLPPQFILVDEDKQIEIEPEKLLKDITTVRYHISMLAQVLISIQAYRVFEANIPTESTLASAPPDVVAQLRATMKKMKEDIQRTLDLLVETSPQRIDEFIKRGHSLADE